MMTNKEIVTKYLTEIALGNYDEVFPLLHEDLEFNGPFAHLTSAQQLIEAYKRMGPVLLRSDVQTVLVEGDLAMAWYDFVTDSDAGAVPCVERIRFDGGKIRTVDLVYDRQAFEPARLKLAGIVPTSS